jgi:hypothetical protein
MDLFKGKSNNSEMVLNISKQKLLALTIILAST